MHRLAIIFCALAAFALLSACASSQHAGASKQPRAALEGVGPFLEKPRDIPIFRGDGSRANWSDIVAQASAADAVLIGENHGYATGLAVAAAVWADILVSPRAAGSNGPSLALEFWERDEQNALDDYLTGVTDEAAFHKAAGPSKARDSASYPRGHREMVEAAKAAGRPVIAANAPRRYVRLARTEGLDRLRALNPRQQQLFRVPDTMFDGRYRDDFEKTMGGTALADGPRQHEAMFRAQSVWDWTMSQSIAQMVEAGNTPAMLVVGCFHIDHQGGLVQALLAQRPATRIVTISFESEDTPTSLPEAEKGRADFIIYAGKR